MKNPETTVIPYFDTYLKTGKNDAMSRILHLSETIAEVKECNIANTPYNPKIHYRGELYFVPVYTMEQKRAERLNITSENNLYGGVVPVPYMAAKSVTHGLIDNPSFIPQGWVDDFPHATKDAVLPGHTVFSELDAFRAAKLLKDQGFTPRGKRPDATSGDDQKIITTSEDVTNILATIQTPNLQKYGYVIEANIIPETVRTLSVGQIMIDGIYASYYGIQKSTKDIGGIEHYGGTEMYLLRGNFSDLLTRVQDKRIETAVGNLERDNIIRAITQAQQFDTYAINKLKIYGSRRNYDIVQGYTSDGKFRSGVTDQSWRIGGASGPEILGIQAFKNDPNLQALIGSSYNKYIKDSQFDQKDTRRYGELDRLTPPNATVHFIGIGGNYQGRLVAYTTLHKVPDSYKQI